MIKLNNFLKIFPILIFAFFIGSLFSLKINIKALEAQTTKYTVFKTENEGFKFYKMLGGQKLWAPLFAQTPTITSDKNQVATKEYVDAKMISGGIDVRYYHASTCLSPDTEIVIGGTDRDFPNIGGDPAPYPSNRLPIDQDPDRFIYVGKDNFVRKYPVGLENSKWVSCLKVPSNPVIGYVVVPIFGSASINGNPIDPQFGRCDFTENYQERDRGVIRNFFKRPCTWSTKLTWDGGNIKVFADNITLPNINKPIKSVSLDLYSNDGGYCLARFKTREGFELELAITANTEPMPLPFTKNFNFDSLGLWWGASYSQVGPLRLKADTINFNFKGDYKVLQTTQIEGRPTSWSTSWYAVRAFKPSNSSITPAEFWKKAYVNMQGKTYNYVQAGVNICKLVLWFE